jgi:hypothetical protein
MILSARSLGFSGLAKRELSLAISLKTGISLKTEGHPCDEASR